jgi:hypothetical protein
MKKLLQKAAVITLLSTSALNVFPASSHAIIGGCVGFVGLAVLGVGVVVGAHLIPEDGARRWGVNRGGIALYGLVMLEATDDKGSVSPHFAPIQSEKAQMIGVTAEEMSAFNSELDEINTVSQTIFNEALNSKLQGQQLEDFISQQWATNGQQLSPEAQVAVAKVRAAVRAEASRG